MNEKFNFHHTYDKWTKRAKKGFRSRRQAMHYAIGGQFEAMGMLELELLRHYGLKPEHYLIDVGCGSGRLAAPLAGYLTGRYLGTDVVEALIDYAREQVQRSDWRFEITSNLRIPERENQADMVCFFSVLTHLLHEQSYVYLREARRVVKRGGSIVFSFLEFNIPSHWAVFESNLRDIDKDTPLNMFIGRDAIDAWATHLDLEIVAVHDGDKPHIPLSQPVTLEDGTVFEEVGNLGQSVCILRKP